MDAFIEAYFAIDKDHSESITMDELRDYMTKNNMDPAFMERWRSLFDPENTGVITLEKFCDVLGLELQDIREKYPATEITMPTDVMQISGDMTDTMKLEVINMAKEAEKKFPASDKDMVKWVKQTMDSKHGRLWHAVIIRGQYYSYYSYEPGCSFCFKMGPRIFIVFKTPCY